MNMNEVITRSAINNTDEVSSYTNVVRGWDKKPVPHTVEDMLSMFDDEIADTETMADRIEVVRDMISENKKAEKYNKKADENERIIAEIKTLVKQTGGHEIRQDVFGDFVAENVDGLPRNTVPRQRIECALTDMASQGKVKRFWKNEGKTIYPCFVYID